MGLKVTTEINSASSIEKRLGLNDNGKVQAFARDDMDRLMNQYIPFDEGDLRRLKSYPNAKSITYTSDYAHYQYYGKAMVAENGSAWAKEGEKKHYSGKKLNYHTSGTGSKWDKVMLEKRGNELIQDIQNYVDKGGK